MLIRSQNKKNLTNLSQVTNVTIITRDSRFKIMACYPVEDGYDYMGEYSTETKAIKVLDMIQSLYDNLVVYREGKDRDPMWYGSSRVFQMPTDEEMDLL